VRNEGWAGIGSIRAASFAVHLWPWMMVIALTCPAFPPPHAFDFGNIAGSPGGVAFRIVGRDRIDTSFPIGGPAAMFPSSDGGAIIPPVYRGMIGKAFRANRDGHETANTV